MAEWHCAESSWMTQLAGWLIWSSVVCSKRLFKMFMYAFSLTVLFTKFTRPTLLDMHPHNFWFSRCSRYWPNTLDETPHLDGMAHHIWGLPSDPCRLNLDSSEKITLSHCACVHLACSLTHCSLAVIIFSVSSGLCLGCLAANSPLNKRLLTVIALAFMPEDSSHAVHTSSLFIMPFCLSHSYTSTFYQLTCLWLVYNSLPWHIQYCRFLYACGGTSQLYTG